jgi:hypothetical protein
MAAKADIMKTGPVPKILSEQKQDGYWGKPEDFYVRCKYKGTVWNLILLAQLGADGNDERIKRACEFVLDNAYDRIGGGFSAKRSTATIPPNCFTRDAAKATCSRFDINLQWSINLPLRLDQLYSTPITDRVCRSQRDRRYSPLRYCWY